ncbi:MAG: multi-sensor signal transduction histidine kinase [Phycisphaerales bacterium]|nr:multi-sensor signal transduction histidine kinase [Phycisphaerales bacterium]
MPRLMSMLPGLVPMNPASAVCFILAGFSLWSRRRAASPLICRAGWACAAIVGLVGLLRLLSYAVGWDWCIDQVLYSEKLQHVAFGPNRMAPNTALNFLLLSAALLFWNNRLLVMRRIGTGLVLLTILASLLAIIGYINGANSLYGIGSFMPMALHTAGTFVVLSVGLLLAEHPTADSDIGVDDGPGKGRGRARRGSLERSIAFGFAAALFMSVAVGVAAFMSIARFAADIQWNDHTRDLLLSIGDLASGLKDAESGVRAFVISGEEEHLRHYRAAADVATASLKEVRAQTIDNPSQQRRLDDLGPLVDRRLTNLRFTIESRQARGFDPAHHAALAREGEGLMDAARALLAQMRGEEESLLKSRSASLDSSTRTTVGVIIGGSGLAFVLVGFSGFVIRRDMGARDRAERHVRELNQHLDQHAAQLEAANKELEAFSYSVSHDLRAPLRSIDGFSKAILEDYADKLDADGKDHLRRVCGAADRMGRLIDDMLNLSRVTRGEQRSETLDLSAIARTVLAELKNGQPDRCVDVTIDGGITAEGDPRMVRALLDNLLGNAWKFTSKRPNARIEFSSVEMDGQCVFRVRDNGAGFDMAYSNKLFGTFQRLHAMEEFSGTGVGLATVKRIIIRHGGRVWAEAEVDKGATFYFTLNSSKV